jgi:hypothetical protein
VQARPSSGQATPSARGVQAVVLVAGSQVEQPSALRSPFCTHLLSMRQWPALTSCSQSPAALQVSAVQERPSSQSLLLWQGEGPPSVAAPSAW